MKDTEKILAAISDLAAKSGLRIDGIESALRSIETKVDALDTRLTAIEARVAVLAAMGLETR